MTRDLTQGKPLGLLISFAFPTLLGLLFQQLYSMVDTMIVGHLLGPLALAAVGATGSVQFLVLGFCTGICSGFAIPVANRMGAQDLSSMRNHLWNSVYLSAGFAVVITIATALLAHQIITAMHAPLDIAEGAYRYLFIIFLGIPATFLYNLPAGMMRALGDSKTPVYFLATASLINIGLDFLFIMGLHMGVAGAAIATVISQLFSGLVCVVYMRHKFTILQSTPAEQRIHWHTCKILLSVGVPMGLQYSITAVGSIILQTAVNGLGSLVVTATSLAQKVSLLFFCPFDALGGTIATYCGQNVGAGRLDRVQTGMKAALFIGFGCALFALVVVGLFGHQLCQLFLDGSEVDAIALAVQFLRINANSMVFLSFVMVYRFAMQGMGFGQLAMLGGVMEMVSRMISGFYLVPTFGFIMACYSNPMAWALASLFLVPGAYHCLKHLRKQCKIFQPI